MTPNEVLDISVSQKKNKLKIDTALRVRAMVFNTTFNYSSVISWRLDLMAEKTTDLAGVTEKLDDLMFYRISLALSRVRTHNVSDNKH